MGDFARKRFRKLEIIGAVVVCVCAPLLHFVFEWSGENFAVGLLAATNESVWEHTKLIYVPMLVYSIIEYFILKPDFKRFLCAKAAALAIVSLVMIAFFYSYTGAFGIELLIFDIICTFAWTILGFAVSYRLYRSRYRLERYFLLFCVLFLVQFAAQVLFTPFTPDIPLFHDHSH